MASDHFTGYGVLQDSHWQEAQKSRFPAYTQPEYECQHSQNTYLFQFESYAARLLSDAPGAGGCCGDPVQPWGNTPQWSDAPAMQGTECAKKEICVEPIIHIDVEQTWCADQVQHYRGIQVRCWQACDDLQRLQQETLHYGEHGTFYFVYFLADSMIMDYEVYPETYDDIYNNCSGTETFSEYFCGTHLIRFTLKADIYATDGCYCDCCGDGGYVTPPVLALTGGTMTATWQNTLDISGEVAADEACRSGTLSGVFTGTLSGTQSVPWTTNPYFDVGPSTRRIVGEPGTIGSSSPSLSACCGGQVDYDISDGCGDTDTVTRTLSAKWSSSDVTAYVGGSPVANIEVGDNVTIRLEDACAYTTAATLGMSDDCVTGSSSDVPQDGYMTWSLNSIALNSTFACKGCCGAGALYSSWNNGCNGTGSKSWGVYNPESSGSTTRGAVMWCADQGSGLYQPAWQALQCDGTTTGSGTLFGSPVVGVDTCNALIDEATDALPIALCGGGAVTSDCGNCCRFSHNGGSGTGFQSAIFCVDNTGWSTTPICCYEVFSNDNTWITNSSSTCCPN